MLTIHPITSHNAGSAYLVLGETEGILLDATLPFCAEETVETLRRLLGKRRLSAILLSHSHYDHIAGLGIIHTAFPEVPIYAHPYAGYVFTRPSALRAMGELCEASNALYGSPAAPHFDPRVLSLVQPVADGQTFSIDGEPLTVLFTPGHTNDALSFDFPTIKTTWLSETLGFLRPDGKAQPCFLSSYTDALASFDRIEGLGHRRLWLPHSRCLACSEAASFLTASRAAAIESVHLIRSLAEAGHSPEEILAAYTDRYWLDYFEREWPKFAFTRNAIAAITAVLREFPPAHTLPLHSPAV